MMRFTGVTAVAILLTGLVPAVGTGQQGDGAIALPLSQHEGRLVVPVYTEGGRELSFLVSTASAVTVVSQSVANALGSGGLRLGEAPVVLDGMQAVPAGDLVVEGRTFHGQIGNNTLNRYDVLFDLPGGWLLLKPFARRVSWDGYDLGPPVRLRVYHGVVLGLDVEVAGRSYPAMLALGSPELLVNDRVLTETGAVDGGRTSLGLGPVRLADVPIRRSEHPVLARFSPAGDGFVLVGSTPALRCPLAISWVHREVRSCPR